MSRLLLLVLLAVTAFAAEEPVPTHLKVKASFTRLDKDGKPEIYAEPTVITVDGKQTTIRVGSADEGVVFTVTPKVNKDGTLTLDADLESREAAPLVSSAPAVTPAAPAQPPRPKSNLPFFHGVLTKDKLFSIEDASAGPSHRWLDAPFLRREARGADALPPRPVRRAGAPQGRHRRRARPAGRRLPFQHDDHGEAR
jgi:hypothetical protein